MRLSPVIFVLAVAPLCAAAQAVPTRTLARPDAEWSEPFSQISGIRELKNGNVIVADSRDKTIQLIDFKGEARPIGREGSGPGEYGLPMAVFAAPADTTLVFDVLNSRYLMIDPAGKAVSTFTMPSTAPVAVQPGRGGGRGFAGIGLGFAQGIDANGRLYFRAPLIRFGNESPATVDTTPVLRWDRRANHVDTVGLLFSPAVQPSITRGGRGGGDEVRVSVRVGGGATPFASSDAYAVTPAGDVAVVRARDYHVDWITRGRTTSGAPIPFEKVRVTEQDKKAWADARRNATGIMMTNENGNRRMQSAPVGQDGPPPEFPEFKGPFANGVAAAPNGQVWVQKYMPFGSPPTYDVIDQSGKVASRVVLPKSTRLLGFGTGTVYLARTDDDDLQYVQRYRW